MSYEFTKEQNDLIDSLASKMSLVGMLSVVIGIVNLFSTLMLLVFVFQDRLPTEMIERIPPEVRSEMPPRDFLWGIILQGMTMGLIFLMIGIWTRAAAAAFRGIVATSGRDITHLMAALGNLHKKYALMYFMIMIALVFFLLGLLLQLALRYAG